MFVNNWIDEQKIRLASQALTGYASGGPICAEPVAIAALAACGHGLRPSADTACQCLLAAQNADGSISVRLNREGPFWTTSLACIAWRKFCDLVPAKSAIKYTDAYRRGIEFLLSLSGEKIEPSDIVGHNTQLVGWPWVQGTHSWLEPTALALMALRHCGFAGHPRALEAAELIVDRLLVDGGANYGNTYVLGQELRPHVMPSALCMVALHRAQPRSTRQAASYAYLRRELRHPMAAASLAWTIHALVSEQWEVAQANVEAFQEPLQSAVARSMRSGNSSHSMNLLLLASLLRRSPVLDFAELVLPQATRLTP